METDWKQVDDFKSILKLHQVWKRVQKRLDISNMLVATNSKSSITHRTSSSSELPFVTISRAESSASFSSGETTETHPQQKRLLQCFCEKNNAMVVTLLESAMDFVSLLCWVQQKLSVPESNPIQLKYKVGNKDYWVSDDDSFCEFLENGSSSDSPQLLLYKLYVYW